MKRLWIVAGLLLCVWFLSPGVSAAEVSSQELQQWLEEVGGTELPEQLPEDTRERMEEAGVAGALPQEIAQFSTEKFFAGIWGQITAQLPEVCKTLAILVGMLLLCAMVQSAFLSRSSVLLQEALTVVGILAILTILLPKLLDCMEQLSVVLQSSSLFLLGCIPILLGFVFAAGAGASGSACGGLLLALCNGISAISAVWILPVLRILLGFSVVSSVAPKLQLEGICKSCFSILKWILGFAITLFATLLSMQKLLGDGIAATTNRTVKFVVSSFVPIVGTALGEAFGTIQNCAGMLRSSVGAFGILGIALLFLPVILQCVLWNGVLCLTSGIGDIFALHTLSALFRSMRRVLSMMLALLCCTSVLLIVSLQILMRLGG